jgi:hypothetical protein
MSNVDKPDSFGRAGPWRGPVGADYPAPDSGLSGGREASWAAGDRHTCPALGFPASRLNDSASD